MDKKAQTRIIAIIIGVWGLFRLSSLAKIFDLSFQVSRFSLVLDLVTGLILTAGSLGLLMNKKLGAYLSLTGLIIVLITNIWLLFTSQGSIPAVIVNLLVIYYLNKSRDALR